VGGKLSLLISVRTLPFTCLVICIEKEVKVPTWVLVHPGHSGSENEEKRHFIGTSWHGIENEQE